jgi:hypothetical protein
MATTFAVPDGRVAMAATTYTGTNATLAVSNAVNTVSFQPDLVWLKSRSIGASSHALYDTNRGARVMLQSNTTIADFTDSAGVGMTAFNANGFSLGTDTAAASCSVNGNGVTFIGWQWKAGGTAVSNTAGTITSTVSANTTAGFSIVTYTGTGANATVGHGLGVAPAMIIAKKRNNPGNWMVYHSGISGMSSGYIFLNTTAAFTSGSPSVWNSTAPAASVFSLGSDANINGSGLTNVAYCWAPVAGYSAFGSYTGNGSADGPFIYTGFRPRFLMIKSSSGVFNWFIEDSSRNTTNVTGLDLSPNLSDAEANNSPTFDFLSNGFKLRNTYTSQNGSGSTYIYAAFAENPLKFSNAR